VKFVGADKLHAAFLNESRIRGGCCLGADYRKSGDLAKNERDMGHPLIG
jgi:hypothetical protein